MTVKLSSTKITRLLRMHFQGFTQLSIASKLKITQAAVSLYINEFSAMAEEEGLEAAAKEFGILDIVKELHSLGAELKNSNSTIEDAKRGLKVAVVLEECGVPEEEYKDVVATCLKMKQEGFQSAAKELRKLEEESGLSYGEIVGQASSSQAQLKQTLKELATAQEQVAQAKHSLTLSQQQAKQTLAQLAQHKKDAENDLQQHMAALDMDHKRLEKVEGMAALLKEAGIPDKEIDIYIQRQKLLNKTHIAIDMFAQILNAAKVTTAPDGGKSLLKKLSEYGSLDGAVAALKQEKQILTSETQDLHEKAKLKGSLQIDITHLQVKKEELEGSIVTVNNEQDKLSKNVNNLKNEKITSCWK